VNFKKDVQDIIDEYLENKKNPDYKPSRGFEAQNYILIDEIERLSKQIDTGKNEELENQFNESLEQSERLFNKILNVRKLSKELLSWFNFNEFRIGGKVERKILRELLIKLIEEF